MANYVKIQIRRDNSTNWAASNPTLAIGEIGADMTLHRIKVGDGVTVWNSLPWVNGDVYNNLETILKTISGTSTGTLKDPVNTSGELTTKYPSPSVGDMAYVTAEKKFYYWDGSSWKPVAAAQGGVDAGAVNTLIDNKFKQFGTLGMGYTVNSFNGQSKPTKITFADGLVADLTWSGTRLERINCSDGSSIVMQYNADGLITGRTVTHG